MMIMPDSFVENLASPKQPVPGGGAAAAYAGFIGLALLEKIIRLEMQRHQNTPAHSFWKNLLDQVSDFSENLDRLRDADGKSYMRLAAALSTGENPQELAKAFKQATDCPMQIMEQAANALGCIAPVAERCKRHLLADIRVVCELLKAAVRAAYFIAEANLHLMADPKVRSGCQNSLDRLYTLGGKAAEAAEAGILQRENNIH